MPISNLRNSILSKTNSNGATNVYQTSFTDISAEICFGMLCDLPIQWTSTAGHQRFNNIRPGIVDHEDISDIKLLFSDQRGDIVDASGNIVAVLNKKIRLALSKVVTSINSIRFNGNFQRENRNYSISRIVHQGKLSSYCSDNRSSIDFLVFGPRSVGNNLAKELSKFNMFLQHPITLPSGFLYDNPQYLSIAGSSFSNGSLLPPVTGFDEMNNSFDVPSSQEDDEQQVDTLAYVLDHLPRHSYLKEADIDPRISTVLLSHQKEGVNFILRREYHNTSNPRSLWKRSGLSQDRQVYHHLITESTSDKPDDTRGGILADAMGVGKTLTMIASIVSCLKEKNYITPVQELQVPVGIPKTLPVNSTLILVPSALLLDGWISEIEKHVVPGTLRYYKYHGPNRRLPVLSNLPYDIILSTYGTVSADLRRGGGVLYSFKWYRLVLDEAHVIRNWPTKQFRAVMELDATTRWCMTGTPIQNNLEDLASLVRFLRVPILEDVSIFRRYIIGRKKTASGTIKPNFEKLRLLLNSICLRRNTSVLSQLGVTFTTCKPELSSKEREVYNGLAIACKKSIEETVSCKTTQNINQRPILEALLRMRIFCNLGLEIEVDNGATLNVPNEISGTFKQNREIFCTCCGSHLDDIGGREVHNSTQNYDLLCVECAPPISEEIERIPPINSSLLHSTDGTTDMELNTSTTNEMGQGRSSCWECPSKLSVLLDNIKRQDPQDKSIVFSSWIRSLDAVARLLSEHGITFRRIDGSLPVAQRKQMLSEFRDPSVRIMLMTLGTGAVGLNQLSIASQLHLLEPQWNPSVESQAIGRVIRLDQKKQVTITRYVTTSTIEESVENRQALKLRLAMAGGLQSSSSDHTERIQALRELAEAIQTQLKPKVD
ncbi:SNF2 family N-terminal domain-containing protein [Annulohypoxylon bovei var. microspora]|nr:SNF2 family N-terminal domain-containing protein [Annulohypoxylon bovei var. microspora]